MRSKPYDLRAEFWIASAAVVAVNGESGRPAYALVQRLGEVRGEDLAGEFADEFRPALELGVDVLGKAAPRPRSRRSRS
jgi:hypothetical protein